MPDEIVSVLRAIKGKEVADKHFRRLLRRLRDSQINLIAKKHSIPRALPRAQKIKLFINQGVGFREMIGSDIFKDGVGAAEKKSFLNTFIAKDLKISLGSKGVTVADKLQKLVEHFNQLDEDSTVGMSLDGYHLLLRDVSEKYPKLNAIIKEEFELQNEEVLSGDYLLDYNIKPRDILELIAEDELLKVCETLGIKSRGDCVHNILHAYKDTQSILIEHYELLANRDYKGLQAQGINIRETDIGLRFEEITAIIFDRLGLQVDRALKKAVSTAKDKVDIVIRNGETEVILVECKTSKNSGYTKFSSISRQIASYQRLLERKGYRVIKSLVVANDFTDDFVNACELEMSLNISLIKAPALLRIYNAFRNLPQNTFPINSLMRDVVIDGTRVVKALDK